jgi:hypothetical protein
MPQNKKILCCSGFIISDSAILLRMNGLLIIAAIFALLLSAAAWRFVHQLRRRKVVSGLMWSGQSLLFFCLFLIIILMYSNLHTYQRLTQESLVADVYLHKLGPQKYQLSLSFSESDENSHYYVLQGDQWQLDARILKWKSWANLIGLDSYYQLERLSGRYQNIKQANRQPATVIDLSQASRGLDIWKLKHLLREKLWFVDTLFGQGVYMPMIDGAHFQVNLGQSGLIVRPVNQRAQESPLD